jgi:hypothetical protein
MDLSISDTNETSYSASLDTTENWAQKAAKNSTSLGRLLSQTSCLDFSSTLQDPLLKETL